jgi:hypothetical protein
MVALNSGQDGWSWLEPERPDLARARAHLAVAREERARLLMAVSTGEITLGDLIVAARPEEAPARKITLLSALVSTGRGERRSLDAIERFIRFSSLSRKDHLLPRRVKVAHIVDGRTRGRRLSALADALAVDRYQVPGGFPFSCEDVQD